MKHNFVIVLLGTIDIEFYHYLSRGIFKCNLQCVFFAVNLFENIFFPDGLSKESEILISPSELCSVHTPKKKNWNRTEHFLFPLYFSSLYDKIPQSTIWHILKPWQAMWKKDPLQNRKRVSLLKPDSVTQTCCLDAPAATSGPAHTSHLSTTG